MKTCTKCKETKSYTDFHKNKVSADGYRPDCKLCKAKLNKPADAAKLAYMRDYAKSNRASMNEYDARYRAKKGYRVLEGKMPKGAWEAMIVLYEGKCAKCGDITDLTLDHVVPVTKGGSHELVNAQILCRTCNSAKGNRSADDYREDVRLVDCIGY